MRHIAKAISKNRSYIKRCIWPTLCRWQADVPAYFTYLVSATVAIIWNGNKLGQTLFMPKSSQHNPNVTETSLHWCRHGNFIFSAGFIRLYCFWWKWSWFIGLSGGGQQQVWLSKGYYWQWHVIVFLLNEDIKLINCVTLAVKRARILFVY